MRPEEITKRTGELAESALLLFRVGSEGLGFDCPRTDEYWRLLLAAWLLYRKGDTLAAFSGVQSHLNVYLEKT